LVTPVVTVFRQGLSRSAAAAIELLGDGFAGTVVSDRFSAYNHLPTHQRQLCWAHLKRDLTAIAERTGASAEFGAQLPQPRQQLFEHWHQWKAGATDWLALQRSSQPLRLAFEQTLQRVVELGCQKGEQSPWAKTVRTCQQLANQKQALWTFLEHPGIEPTNNAAVDEVFSAGGRALRPAVIQRKITGLPSNSRGVQSANGALCRSRPLTVTTTLRQQGRDVWDVLEQAWIAQHHGGVMPSLLPDP
jgi:transposase